MGRPRHRAEVAPIFDPDLHLSPYTLFRRLAEGRAPLLIDLGDPTSRLRLFGSEPLPAADWQPPDDREVVLVDGDGERAGELARRLREQGFGNVRALFGGLELYDFALDPEVVGEERFLQRS